jgi:hypothetical protein
MPAPSVATWSVEVLVGAHTFVVTQMDTGAPPAKWRIRSAADVLLAEGPLTDPCGTVNGTTGQLTLTPDGRDDSATASGTAAYAELCESDNTVHLSIPCQAGSSAVSGKCVLNTLTITAGLPVEILSITVG